MELRANDRPFLYAPLGQHFEQQYHVHHRLSRAGAGTRIDAAAATPESIAAALTEALAAPSQAEPVRGGGAARAAAIIAEVL
jgi:UDP-N-acetylglucosamine:LPS N-acetylglucosamine transferase